MCSNFLQLCKSKLTGKNTELLTAEQNQCLVKIGVFFEPNLKIVFFSTFVKTDLKMTIKL